MPGEDPLHAGQAVSGGHADSRRSRVAGRTALPWKASRLGRRMPLLAGTAMQVSFAGHAEAAAIGLSINTVDVIQLAVTIGVMGAAFVSAIVLIRERARTAAENAELRTRIADINAALQRSEALLNLRDQRVVVWPADNKKPELIGTLPIETGAPEERAAFLAFGRWLMPRSAAALEHAVAGLRQKGNPFDLVAESLAGAPLEIHGRKSAAHAMVRFVSLSQALRSEARLKLENRRLATEHDTMRGLLDALKMPFWMRAADGRLKWVNRAYAAAVEAPDAETAIRDGKEFLGGQAREAIADRHKSRPVFEQTLSTVIEGDRRMFAVVDFADEEGSAGLACDISAVEAVREEYERTMRGHADTLDQLNTAVAIFDAEEKLRFFNQAFQKL